MPPFGSELSVIHISCTSVTSRYPSCVSAGSAIRGFRPFFVFLKANQRYIPHSRSPLSSDIWVYNQEHLNWAERSILNLFFILWIQVIWKAVQNINSKLQLNDNLLKAWPCRPRNMSLYITDPLASALRRRIRFLRFCHLSCDSSLRPKRGKSYLKKLAREPPQ